MITLETLIVTIHGLDRAEVEHWIAEDWIRPVGREGTWLFREIDVARLRLIRELRSDLGLQEEALPVVLRLMDQLYDERRRLRFLRDALERTVPADVRALVDQALRVPQP